MLKISYNKETDTYTCPQGKLLRKRHVYEGKGNMEYSAEKRGCADCPLRSQCTRSKGPRTVQRHLRKEELDFMIAVALSYKSKEDLATRKHLMERSYARSTRFGFDRARWRGLRNVAIQEYLICAIQNIQVLIRYIKRPAKGTCVLFPAQSTIGGLFAGCIFVPCTFFMKQVKIRKA